MRTLVTGGAGFIRTHLVRRLLERGDDVVVVLDSLEAQVHGDRTPEVVDLVGSTRGTSAILLSLLARCAAWIASPTWPPPSESASRCTRSTGTRGRTR
jgi:nucleoside-diphosphate-sugar epimerase